MKGRQYAFVCSLLGIILMLYPLVASRYQVFLFIQAMIYAVFCTSYYLLLGQTGLLSFGHAAYFGIGAYSTALCLIHFPTCPVLISIFIGSMSGLLAGLIIGAFLVRLSKIYLALGTLAFSQLIWAVAWKWRPVTGGDDGLTGWTYRKIALPLLGPFTINNITFLYYVIVPFAVIAIWICWLFIRTPLGNTLASIRVNQGRAQFLGINVYLAKFIVFGFSAFIAALSGSMHSILVKMVTPRIVDIYASFDVVIMSILGGYSRFLGPIIGSFVYVFLQEYLAMLTSRWQLIMGGVFTLIVLFCPNGLMQLAEVFSKKMRSALREG